VVCTPRDGYHSPLANHKPPPLSSLDDAFNRTPVVDEPLILGSEERWMMLLRKFQNWLLKKSWSGVDRQRLLAEDKANLIEGRGGGLDPKGVNFIYAQVLIPKNVQLNSMSHP